MDRQKQQQAARLSLEGLSIGDAFGQHIFRQPGLAQQVVTARRAPPPPWRYSDDTVMALHALRGSSFAAQEPSPPRPQRLIARA
jgi:hypothetical protein